MSDGPFTIGSTYKWSPTFLKDGSIFDLSGASISINFRGPNNVLSSFAMTITGINLATYTNATTLFTIAGQWYRSYTISVGGVVLQSKGIEFQVYPSVSAGF